jgi:hypothetical protein
MFYILTFSYRATQGNPNWDGRSSNGVEFRVGDSITLKNLLSEDMYTSNGLWRAVDGTYRILDIGFNQPAPMSSPSILMSVSGPSTSKWDNSPPSRDTGSSINIPFTADAPIIPFFRQPSLVTSSRGARIVGKIIRKDVVGGVEIIVDWWAHLYAAPNFTGGFSSTIRTAGGGGIIKIDDPVNYPGDTVLVPSIPVTPTSPPTIPTPPPSTVKRVGTTVTVPFLSSASFKPGTNARANERGKAAFIKAVQAASKASNLNKSQSDQLMADVVKAIKDADLKRRKITPLKKR